MSAWRLDSERLAGLLDHHRDGRSCRAVAREAGVSLMTVNRVQRGEGCDLATLLALSNWMSEDPRTFLCPSGGPR